ncbi:MAG: hypothetical protein K9H25_06740 [Rhodospirillum sp.]|nr:hypothetical protein [Rhodospirillum sp.]MCF8487704.1 hypothetical protein [Rhodospirillum sp.]
MAGRIVLLALALGFPWSTTPCAAEPRGDAWIEANIDRAPGAPPPYQGEMVLVTVKGYYHDFRIGKEHLSTPSTASFDWVQLGRDSWTDAMVDGRKYTVVTRKLALFPRESGKLTIEPFLHHLTLIDGDGQWFTRDITSSPETLEVLPPPADPSRSWWLPARSITFSDVWDRDPATLKDNETATRTVTITALGANPQTLPPTPALRERWLITFTEPEQRTVQPTEAGPETTVTWIWRLRPITGEPGVIPEVRIPWFDTKDRVPKEIVLAAAPIGNQGFGGNTTAHWANHFEGGPLLTAVALAGLGLGLWLTLSGRSLRFEAPDPIGWGKDLRRNWSNRQALREALAAKDSARIHRAAWRLLADWKGEPPPAMTQAMVDLDRVLHARNNRHDGADANKAIRKAFLG